MGAEVFFCNLLVVLTLFRAALTMDLTILSYAGSVQRKVFTIVTSGLLEYTTCSQACEFLERIGNLND
jgi:hypothetical protein